MLLKPVLFHTHSQCDSDIQHSETYSDNFHCLHLFLCLLLLYRVATKILRRFWGSAADSVSLIICFFWGKQQASLKRIELISLVWPLDIGSRPSVVDN